MKRINEHKSRKPSSSLLMSKYIVGCVYVIIWCGVVSCLTITLSFNTGALICVRWKILEFCYGVSLLLNDRGCLRVNGMCHVIGYRSTSIIIVVRNYLHIFGHIVELRSVCECVWDWICWNWSMNFQFTFHSFVLPLWLSLKLTKFD